jgi:hypothetical protein
MNQIAKIGSYARTAAKARWYFGEDIQAWRKWLKKGRVDARALRESLFVDDPNMGMLMDELSAFAVAVDLVLRMYDGQDGQMTDAEGVLKDAIEATGPIYEEAAKVNA